MVPPVDGVWLQGFSYPLEDSACSDSSNGFDAMNKDFAQMKRDFGATIVRLYYPTCTQTTVFRNAIKAAVANDMAVILQAWTNFGDGVRTGCPFPEAEATRRRWSERCTRGMNLLTRRKNTVWQQSQKAIYDTMSSADLGPIAPYVVHSADFGSEPVGDGMDAASTQFVTDLGKFRQKMNSYGVKAGISEDWGSSRNHERQQWCWSRVCWSRRQAELRLCPRAYHALLQVQPDSD